MELFLHLAARVLAGGLACAKPIVLFGGLMQLCVVMTTEKQAAIKEANETIEFLKADCSIEARGEGVAAHSPPMESAGGRLPDDCAHPSRPTYPSA